MYVDCTAAGLAANQAKPVFEPGRITMQLTTLLNLTWSAATLGVVEARRDYVAEQNRLCPPIVPTDLLPFTYVGMSGQWARSMEPDLADWDARCRLSFTRGAADRMDDPQVAEGLASVQHVAGDGEPRATRRRPRRTGRLTGRVPSAPLCHAFGGPDS